MSSLKIIAVVSIGCICIFANAQLSEHALKERARVAVDRLGHTLHEDTLRVKAFRTPSPRTRVTDDTISLSLDRISGELGSFEARTSMEPADVTSPDRYPNDAEVEAAAREVIRGWGGPQLDFRVTLIESDPRPEEFQPNWLAPVTTCHFHEQVNGYRGGNRATISMRRRDGKVLSVHVITPFTYEPVDIRVTEAQARARAFPTLGGESAEYHLRLFYYITNHSTAPPEIREMAVRKIMRLCYEIAGGGKAVIIDSKTGEIVSTINGVAGVQTAEQVQPIQSPAKHVETPQQNADPPPKANGLVVAVGIGLVGLALLAGFVLRKMRLKD